MKQYKRIEGDLQIYKSGKIFLMGTELLDDDSIAISISKLKRIIKDAKQGLI